MKQKMTRNTIERLLERFMNGETTLDEERLLADYFRKADDLEEDWQDYREMFAYFDRGMVEKKTEKTGWRLWIAAAVLMVLLAGGSLVLWNMQESDETKVSIIDEHMGKHDCEDTGGRGDEGTRIVKHADYNHTPTHPRTHVPTRITTSTAKPKKHRHEKAVKQAADTSPIEDNQLTEQEKEESFREDIIWRKAAIIQAALQRCGYMPVRQEDGSIDYEKATEDVTNQESLSI